MLNATETSLYNKTVHIAQFIPYCNTINKLKEININNIILKWVIDSKI